MARNVNDIIKSLRESVAAKSKNARLNSSIHAAAGPIAARNAVNRIAILRIQEFLQALSAS
jgi:hypothetical protein